MADQAEQMLSLVINNDALLGALIRKMVLGIVGRTTPKKKPFWRKRREDSNAIRMTAADTGGGTPVGADTTEATPCSEGGPSQPLLIAYQEPIPPTSTERDNVNQGPIENESSDERLSFIHSREGKAPGPGEESPGPGLSGEMRTQEEDTPWDEEVEFVEREREREPERGPMEQEEQQAESTHQEAGDSPNRPKKKRRRKNTCRNPVAEPQPNFTNLVAEMTPMDPHTRISLETMQPFDFDIVQVVCCFGNVKKLTITRFDIPHELIPDDLIPQLKGDFPKLYLAHVEITYLGDIAKALVGRNFLFEHCYYKFEGPEQLIDADTKALIRGADSDILSKTARIVERIMKPIPKEVQSYILKLAH